MWLHVALSVFTAKQLNLIKLWLDFKVLHKNYLGRIRLSSLQKPLLKLDGAENCRFSSHNIKTRRKRSLLETRRVEMANTLFHSRALCCFSSVSHLYNMKQYCGKRYSINVTLIEEKKMCTISKLTKTWLKSWLKNGI